MTTIMTLPTGKKISEYLESLLGRDVTAKVGAAADPSSAVVATYANPEGEILAALVSDFGFAASAGAALTLIPPDVAEECAKDKDLSKTLRENFHEVANVLAMLFNATGGSNVRLKSLSVAPDEPEDAARKVLDDSEDRVDLEVAIEGYASGLVSLFCL